MRAAMARARNVAKLPTLLKKNQKDPHYSLQRNTAARCLVVMRETFCLALGKARRVRGSGG